VEEVSEVSASEVSPTTFHPFPRSSPADTGGVAFTGIIRGFKFLCDINFDDVLDNELDVFGFKAMSKDASSVRKSRSQPRQN
jgi:hypothetical protein